MQLELSTGEWEGLTVPSWSQKTGRTRVLQAVGGCRWKESLNCTTRSVEQDPGDLACHVIARSLGARLQGVGPWQGSDGVGVGVAGPRPTTRRRRHCGGFGAAQGGLRSA